jgi:hypothetical protein
LPEVAAVTRVKDMASMWTYLEEKLIRVHRRFIMLTASP